MCVPVFLQGEHYKLEAVDCVRDFNATLSAMCTVYSDRMASACNALSLPFRLTLWWSLIADTAGVRQGADMVELTTAASCRQPAIETCLTTSNTDKALHIPT